MIPGVDYNYILNFDEEFSLFQIFPDQGLPGKAPQEAGSSEGNRGGRGRIPQGPVLTPGSEPQRMAEWAFLSIS